MKINNYIDWNNDKKLNYLLVLLNNLKNKLILDCDLTKKMLKDNEIIDLCQKFVISFIKDQTKDEITSFLDKKNNTELKSLINILYVGIYTLINNNESDVIEINIKSAFELNNEQIKLIEDKISNKTKKECYSITEIDPTLIGGLVVTYQDFIVDNSLKNKLKLLKHECESDN